VRNWFIGAGAVVVAGFGGGFVWSFLPPAEPQAQAAAETNSTGSWEVSRFRSPNDGSIAVAMTVSTETFIPGRAQTPAGLAMFSLQCAEGNISAILQFGKDVLRDLEGSGNVVYRVNGRSEALQAFQQSTDGTAMGLWSSDVAVPFIERLIGATSLNIEAIPYRDQPIKARFNVAGLDKAITPLREACDWQGV